MELPPAAYLYRIFNLEVSNEAYSAPHDIRQSYKEQSFKLIILSNNSLLWSN
jgi:hypothetical protein